MSSIDNKTANPHTSNTEELWAETRAAESARVERTDSMMALCKAMSNASSLYTHSSNSAHDHFRAEFVQTHTTTGAAFMT